MTERITTPTLPFTLSASVKRHIRGMGIVRLIVGFALTLLIYARYGFAVWVFSVLAIAAIAGVLFFFLGHRRLVLTDEGVTYRNAVGHTRTVAYSDIEGVKVFTHFYEPTFGTVPRVSIGMRDQAAPIVLNGLYWSAEDLDALLLVLNDKNVTVESTSEVVIAKHIATQLPKYATYAERHTALLVVLITLGIVVFAAIFVLVTDFM